MTGAQLKERIIRLQEINITLSTLYAERGGITAQLYADPEVGPALTAGGSAEGPDGFTVSAERKDPDDCSPYERKTLMKSPTGHLLKLKLTMPKGWKP